MSARARLTAPREDVRHGIRALLSAAAGFHGLAPDTRREIASALVRISSAAMTRAEQAGQPQRPAYPRPAGSGVLAQAQAAGDAFSGTAVDRIAPTTRNILNAVSFPRFVGELITGVFKAMNDSNERQLSAYVDLIRNVAATTEGFTDANVGIAGARAWLAERFPSSFAVEGREDDNFDDPARMTEEERAEWQAERDANTRLVLRPGAEMPSQAALRTAFGLGPNESLPAGDPEALVGPARAAIARNRQQMLATMVMLGMQRIVIDSGRLHASMRFHIDASSAASEDRGSRFDMHHTSQAGARARFGPWGAEAKMQNTIGYVSTERTQTEEEINAEVDLNSSVELIFRSDYVPLERLAGAGDVNRIRVNALNPDEEARLASEARKARSESRARSRRERANRLNEGLQPPPPAEMEPLNISEPGGDGAGQGSSGNGGSAQTGQSEAGSADAGSGGQSAGDGSGGDNAGETGSSEGTGETAGEASPNT